MATMAAIDERPAKKHRLSTASGSSTYLFSDPEGVRLTFDSSGSINSIVTYNPYGQITAGGISGITPFGYAGGYTDPTGLVYLVNRYYDPNTGQFLSVDPLAGITGEPYQYVNGDPLNFTDPLGLKICWQALELGLTSASRQCWKSGYKKAGHIINKHKVAIGEIALGVVVVAGVTVATVATGGLFDAVMVGAGGAAEELASSELVGLMALSFPLDVTIALAPVGLVGLGGLALTAYGAYQLYSELSGASSPVKSQCSQQ